MSQYKLVMAVLVAMAGTALPLGVLADIERIPTPHRLQPNSADDRAVCSFCHTPKNGQSGRPLWLTRRSLREFVTFDSAEPDNDYGSLGSGSVICLSCHDGSQAPDSEANIPVDQGASRVPKVRRPGSRDHPVGIPFTIHPADQAEGSGTHQRLRSELIDGEMRWWLDAEPIPNGIRDKTDVVFYTRDNRAAARPFIECASCHDPHAPAGDMFLRVSSSASNLCRTCHNL